MVSVKVREEDRIDGFDGSRSDRRRDANQRAHPGSQNRVGEEASAAKLEQHTRMPEPGDREMGFVHVALGARVNSTDLGDSGRPRGR